eukprot:1158779-Pelagomonas_calceolata.AAC.8
MPTPLQASNAAALNLYEKRAPSDRGPRLSEFKTDIKHWHLKEHVQQCQTWYSALWHACNDSRTECDGKKALL